MVLASLNTVLDFEKETEDILKILNNSQSTETNTDWQSLDIRSQHLSTQFRTKRAFLSGFKLKQLDIKINSIKSHLLKFKTTTNDLNLPKLDVSQKIVNLQSTSILIDENFNNNNTMKMQTKVGKLTRFFDIHDSNLFLDLDPYDDLIIDSVSNSVLTIQGSFGGSLKIKNVSLSKIIFKNILFKDSININNCTQSDLFVSGDQIRVHDSSHCNLHIFTLSGGILENCSNMSISKYEPIFNNSSEKTNLWKNMQDFSLNSETSSIKFIEDE